MNAKPFKVGDNVWPGSGVAEIPDLSTLRLKGKAEEIDRGRMREGQDVRVILDPFPEKPFHGKLDSLSALTEQSFDWPPSRNFRAYASLGQADDRLRPAMNGRMDVIVDRIPNAISVPSKAVFARDGRPVVLVPGKEGLRVVKVEVVARNPDEVAIRGIDAGTQVALVDETESSRKKADPEGQRNEPQRQGNFRGARCCSCCSPEPGPRLASTRCWRRARRLRCPRPRQARRRHLHRNGERQSAGRKLPHARRADDRRTRQLVITELRKSGELVKKDDVVVQFDTTDEVYKLRQAEADLAEAEQQVLQAENEARAKRGRAELRAHQRARRTPAGRTGSPDERDPRRPNGAGRTTSRSRARGSDSPSWNATIRSAKPPPRHRSPSRRPAGRRPRCRRRRRTQEHRDDDAEGARRGLHQRRAEYEHELLLQRHDPAAVPGGRPDSRRHGGGADPRPGQLGISAQVAEEDRGHLSVGQAAEIEVVSLPGRKFHGRVKDLGGTTGPPWERRFECKLTLLDPVPEFVPA